MLKSTCKEVKDKIQGWLIELAKEGLQGYLPQKDYKGHVTEQEIENTPMTAVNRMFEMEKGWQIAQEGRQTAFNDWQRGLCSCLPAYKSLVYYDAIRAKVQEWLEQTDSEANKYEDEVCDDYFLWLIFREFECLIKKEQKLTSKK